MPCSRRLSSCAWFSVRTDLKFCKTFIKLVFTTNVSKKWLFLGFQEVTVYTFLHAVGLKLEGCNLVYKSAIMHPVELSFSI